MLVLRSNLTLLIPLTKLLSFCAKHFATDDTVIVEAFKSDGYRALISLRLVLTVLAIEERSIEVGL